MKKHPTRQYFIDTRIARDSYSGERKLHFEGQDMDGADWGPSKLKERADQDGFPLSVRIRAGSEETDRIFPTREAAHRDYPGPYRDE